jgi:hypothetical protein
VLPVQLLVRIVQLDHAALDEGLRDVVAAHVERIAARDVRPPDAGPIGDRRGTAQGRGQGPYSGWRRIVQGA